LRVAQALPALMVTNPSRSAASVCLRSSETNARVRGRRSEATNAAATCSASAARSRCVRSNRIACSRTSSCAGTSIHRDDAASSLASARCTAGRFSVPSRSRRAMAETHSMRVPHHVTTAGSTRSTRSNSTDVDSRTRRGNSAEASQYLTICFATTRQRPVARSASSASTADRSARGAEGASSNHSASGFTEGRTSRPACASSIAEAGTPVVAGGGVSRAIGTPRSVMVTDAPARTSRRSALRLFFASETEAVRIWLL